MQTKALSLRQPWAWAVICGGKDIENRSWFTSYRGDVIIHAGQSKKDYESGRAWIEEHIGIQVPEIQELDFGALIGTVEIIDCINACSPLPAWGMPECYHWRLRNSHPLAKPVPYKGKLGLFHVEHNIVTELPSYCHMS